MQQRVHALLMIGGASRNVGKTTLTCNIIRHFSKSHAIVGLKIKTIYEGDQFFHGKDRNPLKENYRLIEEFEINGDEDTSKMLKAGAKRAFKLKVNNLNLHEAFIYFLEHIDKNSLIICESNSLRKVVIPDIFLMIKHIEDKNMKPSAIELEEFADKNIFTDGVKHTFQVNELQVNDLKWVLKNL
jgi:hypothetical protein